MKTPNSTLELGDAIESLVASYVEAVRRAAKEAVERALAKPITPTRRASPASRRSTATSRSMTARRTATELLQICDALCERVRAQPGVSMVELAEQMDAQIRSLQAPMAKLKAEGKVRSVGQRHMMRYFPAVVEVADNVA